jgi:hypothetical protein
LDTRGGENECTVKMGSPEREKMASSAEGVVWAAGILTNAPYALNFWFVEVTSSR